MPQGSLRAYARHRGESLKAVQKAIEAGRISKPTGGKLDFEMADEEWKRNTAQRPAQMNAAPGVPPAQVKSAETAGTYATARAIREQYSARLMQLDFQERTGKLLNRDEVEAAAFNAFHILRDQLLTIPDRLAPILAAESEQAAVHKYLEDELRIKLTEFANGLTEPAPSGASVPPGGGGGDPA